MSVDPSSSVLSVAPYLEAVLALAEEAVQLQELLTSFSSGSLGQGNRAVKSLGSPLSCRNTHIGQAGLVVEEYRGSFVSTQRGTLTLLDPENLRYLPILREAEPDLLEV